MKIGHKIIHKIVQNVHNMFTTNSFELYIIDNIVEVNRK